MGRKTPTTAPSEPSESETTAAAAVTEVGIHPGDPISTDETTDTAPESLSRTVATVPTAVEDPNDLAKLKDEVRTLTETVGRLHLIVAAMVNMPEHSSLSRPFAERCQGVLLGSVEVPKIQ